ncbi:MAG TPA: cysteine dioxygenase [Acidimicrobiia bacterium]|nr:cysteine dioxygenase [Acidimicrobiia bacterium]
MTQTIDRSRSLVPPLPPLPPERLLAIVRGLGRDAATWRALAQHDQDERWHLRLSTNLRFDIWLIGWHGHQGVDLHDHGGSAGAFTVIDGELLETARDAGGTGELHETRLTVGSARSFGSGHVHWVVNPTPEIATSVHVYSPPLETMDFYESTADLALTRLRTERAAGARTGLGEIRAGHPKSGA